MAALDSVGYYLIMGARHNPRAGIGSLVIPRYFRLTYSNVGPDDEPKLFHGRDGIAFGELTALLPSLGYEYGTTIHFYPDDERRLEELPAFRVSDLLVLPTRPPLSDRVSVIAPRKIIRDSKSELEKLIFTELSQYFRYCTRKHVQLTDLAKGFVRHDPHRWEHLELFEHRGAGHGFDGAEIMRYFVGPVGVRPTSENPSTVAFLVRVERIRGLKCGLLVSFGMDGYSTLIWNRIVRVRHPEWLRKPGFVMAELIFKAPIPPKPITPEFADDPNHVEVRVLT